MVNKTDADENTSTILRLPDDKKRVKQLENKLLEYNQRMFKHTSRLKSSSLMPSYKIKDYEEHLKSTQYKARILFELLKRKEVNIFEFRFEFEKELREEININLYNESCDIIDDYCKTGGANLRRGTGLKDKN